MNTKLWYQEPASSFQNAIPIGNGSLGAMVYGGVPEERISLNDDTLWSGNQKTEEYRVHKEVLEYAKEVCLKGQYHRAQEIVESQMLGHYNESYVALGAVKYRFPQVKDYTNYKRALDLERAICTTEFTSAKVTYKSEIFASYPDHLIALKIVSSIPKQIELIICFESELRHFTSVYNNGIVITGNAPSHIEPNYVESEYPVQYEEEDAGMAFCGYLTVNVKDGEWYAEKEKIYVKKASEIIIYIVCSNGYQGHNIPVNRSGKECFEKCKKRMSITKINTYAQILDHHLKDYMPLFSRVYAELDDKEPLVPTNRRLENLKKGNEDDKGIYCLYFHYNRYLMLASSRPGTQPSNLQGIWNDSIRPVWSSNWTLNINTEMNYWPVGICNMAECYEPLLCMLEELRINGEKTAEQGYSCRGWVANHNVDIWRQTIPAAEKAKYAYWPMGGIWLSAQIYDYYEYTHDKNLLERIYPIMKGAVLFCVDWLVKQDDGCYVTPLATSPENTFWDENGNECAVSYGSTMDIALVKELFDKFIKAHEALGTDRDLAIHIRDIRKHLPPYKIGKYGQIQEWMEDFQEVDPGHRHFSPLVGFFPGTSINEETTPELVPAVERFLQRRLEYGGGQIGWSCAWLINLYAKLRKGNEAYKYLKQMLTNSSYDNLFDFHLPLGEMHGERECFQIDGNFGSASGFANMLMHSIDNTIFILPAIPDIWHSGMVKGLLAKGIAAVDIYWSQGHLTRVVMRAQKTAMVEIRYKDVKQEINIEKGETTVILYEYAEPNH